jgi:hypothetical protein
MAKKLIEASAAKTFDRAAYPDIYTKRLTELVEAMARRSWRRQPWSMAKYRT